jgi:hypothetical protein
MPGIGKQKATAAVLLFAFTLADRLFGQPAQCPNSPVASISSSQVPPDVCIPAGFPGNPITFFDDYSWKTFIALVWPAQAGRRGVPDAAQAITGSGPKIFETYKHLWEVFHSDGSAPAPWDTYDKKQFNACGADQAFGDVVLASFSKFSDLGQAGFGSLLGPLVAQNRTYVRYLTGFNRVEFDQIAQSKLYLRSNLPVPPAALTFQNGAIDVKSAWIDMTGVPRPERYYTRSALILDPASGTCSKKTVGLIGLHIVQKTPNRPQWVWSTFEHVDNVPPAQADNPGFLRLNDRTPNPMPESNPYPIDPPIILTPPPFNVERAKPVHPSTESTNTVYRQALKNAGSVWQFYQLVMTQWPLQPNSPATPGTPPNTFPGAGSDATAFANTALETFEQKSISTSCMACHNVTKVKTDFVWSLNDHAFPPNVPNFLFHDPSMRQLKNLLRSDVTAMPIGRATSPSTMPMLNTYRDVQDFIQRLLQRNGESGGVTSAPHGGFWTSLSYDEFVNGNVPGVTDPATGRPIPILVKGNSAQSNLILSLQGKGPLFDPATGLFGQMPANGPPMFTAEEIQAIAAWIDRGCPK